MITSIGDVLREAYKRNWISVRDGNISVRRGDYLYVTPSGVRKTTIIPETIVKGKFINGCYDKDTGNQTIRWLNKPDDINVSGEISMHIKLQTIDFKKSKARTVLHLHPTHVISAIEAGWDLREISKRLPELSRYTRVGANVPRVPVTSEILAIETFKSMTNGSNKLMYDIVGQIGHGVCVVDHSPWSCFEHVERLNHACEIILLSGVTP